MGEGFVIVSLIALALSFPVAVIVLLFKVVSLSKRLTQVEARLTAQGTGAPPAPQAAAHPPDAVSPSASGAASAEASPDRTAPPTKPAAPWGPPRDPSRPAAPAPDRPADPELPSLTPAGPSQGARLLGWVLANWFYVAAAAALALAGIFLVQYGAERGLLPPPLRVLAAIGLGLALVVGGEWLRRRWGDGADVATAYLPSVFSGGGVVTLFAAVLGARHLYGLIGPELALVGLAVVALGAIVLGWFHGPLLVSVGLIGGTTAPFVVGGESEAAHALHAYFALLGVVGLAVDAVRRWRGRWVSALAILSGFGGGALLVLAQPATTPAHLAAVVALTLAALSLPVRRLAPNHRGAMLSEVIAGRSRRILAETGLAAGAVAVASVLVLRASGAELWPALFACLTLVAALAIWAGRARALQDLTILPFAAFLACLALAQPDAEGITWALAMGGAMSGLAYLRSLRAGAQTYRIGWALATVVAAPLTGLVLDVAWQARSALGVYPWALHAMAVAAALTGMAGVWAARDGDDRLRPSLAALMTFVVIAYGFGQFLGEAGLTIAVAGMAAMAAWLDRALRLPLLPWFVVLAAPVTGWRLLADPGLDWALVAPVWLALAAFGAAVGGFALAWWWLRGTDKPVPFVVAETAATSFLGLAGVWAVWRGARALELETGHLIVGLTATIWLILAMAQFARAERLTQMRTLRRVLGYAFLGVGLLALALNVTLLNPLFSTASGSSLGGLIQGPVVANSLLAAYLLPALVLLRLRMPWVRLVGAGLAAMWLLLTIRHFWAGPAGMSYLNPTSQPELTSYTFAMLIVGGGLFYQGLATRVDRWRHAGMAVLALTAVKVFFVDAASLTGLLRVAALVGLALALAGLAWLNRWAGTARQDSDTGVDD